MTKRITAIAGLVALLVLVPVPAIASTDDLHPDIAYALDTIPGGVAISDSEAVWPELGMTLETGSATGRAVGSCATGSYCAYAQPGLAGTKLTFTTCTNVSTAALQTVGSIANARSSGKVHARNSAGTVLATVGANGSANVGGVTTNLLCTL